MDIISIANNHISLKKVSADEYAGPCPKCGGNDRFHVWPGQGENGRYWCRQCGIKGDAIQFLREVEGMSFKEACKLVGKEVAAVSHLGTRPRPPAKKTYTPKLVTLPPELWQQEVVKFVEWAHNYLMYSGNQTLEITKWLFARGITPMAIEKYNLGWNPETVHLPLAAWGLPEVKKEDGSLKQIWLPQGLVIPNIRDGIVQSIRIRRFVDTPPRYCCVSGSGDLTLIAMSGTEPLGWVIVENHLDAMMIEQEAGDIVGAMGMSTCAYKPGETAFAMLKRARYILNVLDYDIEKKKNPGGAAGKWWQETFGDKCRRWPVPQGKDPGEAYKAGVNIREWLLAGLPPIFKV